MRCSAERRAPEAPPPPPGSGARALARLLRASRRGCGRGVSGDAARAQHALRRGARCVARLRARERILRTSRAYGGRVTSSMQHGNAASTRVHPCHVTSSSASPNLSPASASLACRASRAASRSCLRSTLAAAVARAMLQLSRRTACALRCAALRPLASASHTRHAHDAATPLPPPLPPLQAPQLVADAQRRTEAELRRLVPDAPRAGDAPADDAAAVRRCVAPRARSRDAQR
jgi:hypothetical protein